ncbi:hypothetical protein ACFWA9_32170 [Kitasatospora sp. NPDC059973]|uniref:hypothetical protein n=1 Tax=Kitasatospora sp. NPDC059973 TaxID=3347020 RepID=UPI00367CEFF8
MLEWILVVLIPVGLVAVAGLAYWWWARVGTERPVEHHSSMPSEYHGTDGAG